MYGALISIAVQFGAPFVHKILAGKIGSGNADLVTDVLQTIANRAGIPVGDLERAAVDDPELIGKAIEHAEQMAPEMMEIYATGLEKQFDLLMAETKGPAWMAAWRPLWMYFLMILWFWNMIALHMINAIMKWALPPLDMTVLLALTSFFMALYMGGHTIKDFAKTLAKGKPYGT